MMCVYLFGVLAAIQILPGLSWNKDMEGFSETDIKQIDLMDKDECEKGTGTGSGCQGDKKHYCPIWAGLGYCKDQRYKTIMERDCCKSCFSKTDIKQINLMYKDKCEKGTGTGSGCQGDKKHYCATWAGLGYCRDQRYKTIMERDCCKSCGSS